MPQYTVPYHQSLDELRAACKLPIGLMFTTQVRNKLMSKYLGHVEAVAKLMFDEATAATLRQQFTCSTCARFMSRMGNVVGLDVNDKLVSVYWQPEVVSDPFMKEVVTRMKADVETSRITNIFNPDGKYAPYVEETDYQEKAYRHFYFPMHELFAADPARLVPYRELEIGKEIDRIHALIRFAQRVEPATIMKVEGWFSANEIRHKGNSQEALRDYNQLAIAIVKLKASALYSDTLAKNDYARETLVTNTVWAHVGRFPNLRSLTGSSLGALLDRAVSGDEDQFAKNEWKSMTSSVNHRRPKSDASDGQVEKTLEWLKENDYLRSLEQVPVLQSELPTMYILPKLYDGVVALPEVKEQGSAFERFATKTPASSGVKVMVPQDADFSRFINDILPLITSAAVDLTGISLSPSFYNRQLHDDSKRIFRWDADGKAPFCSWAWTEPHPVPNWTVPDFAGVEGKKHLFPIYGVTSNRFIGTHDGITESFALLVTGLRNPTRHPPALFPDCILPEFYEHRRSIEQFCRQTSLEVPEGQIAAGLPFVRLERGERSPEIRIPIHVVFTEDGKAQFGADKGIFRLSLRYVGSVDYDKLVARGQADEVVEEDVQDETPVSESSSTGTQPA